MSLIAETPDHHACKETVNQNEGQVQQQINSQVPPAQKPEDLLGRDIMRLNQRPAGVEEIAPRLFRVMMHFMNASRTLSPRGLFRLEYLDLPERGLVVEWPLVPQTGTNEVGRAAHRKNRQSDLQ